MRKNKMGMSTKDILTDRDMSTNTTYKEHSPNEFKKSSEFKMINAALLKEHEDNAELNGYDDDVIKNISSNIEHYGFWGSILVARRGDHYVVLSGHQRLKALKDKGETEIPCTVIRSGLKDWELLRVLIVANWGSARGTGGDPYHLAKNIKLYEEKVYPYEKGTLDENGQKIKQAAGRIRSVFNLSSTTYLRVKTILDMSESLQLCVKDGLLGASTFAFLSDLSKEEQDRIAEVIRESGSEESLSLEALKKLCGYAPVEKEKAEETGAVIDEVKLDVKSEQSQSGAVGE